MADTVAVGTNIAGFDFGCSITVCLGPGLFPLYLPDRLTWMYQGECLVPKASPPLSSLGGVDGIGQMQHFSKDLGMNMFRLPVGWQWLVNGKVGGTLDQGNMQKYDQLMTGCLNTGAYCVIDVSLLISFPVVSSS